MDTDFTGFKHAGLAQQAEFQAEDLAVMVQVHGPAIKGVRVR